MDALIERINALLNHFDLTLTGDIATLVALVAISLTWFTYRTLIRVVRRCLRLALMKTLFFS